MNGTDWTMFLSGLALLIGLLAVVLDARGWWERRQARRAAERAKRDRIVRKYLEDFGDR